MNIDLMTQKITNKYIDNGTDMNSSIAKVASDNNLNIEQTKRLVEECNKTCYLTKFASTGEQTFDIADYEKVKSILQSESIIEKKASVEFTKINKEKTNIYGMDFFEDSLEKTASEHDNLNTAIEKCNSEISSSMAKIAELKYSFASNDKIELIEKKAEEYKIIKNYLIEKRASLTSGLLNTGAKIGGTALNVGAKGAGVVIKHPIKAGLIPLGIVGSFKEGAKKVSKETSSFISNNANSLSKQANATEIKNIWEIAKPYAMLMGAIGIGEAAAKGMGGLASKMMQERQLNNSFQTILENNDDIRQIPNARAYFDVVARHSPDLAKDPMVAPQLIRQFDMFGGVDVNTIGKLREIQQDSPSYNKNKNENYSSNLLGGIGTLHSLTKDRLQRSKI